MQIEDSLEQVHNKKDFINFVNYLVKDLKKNPKEWANTNLEDFLDGISRWVEDSDGVFDLEGIEWNSIASILFIGSRYE